MNVGGIDASRIESMLTQIRAASQRTDVTKPAANLSSLSEVDKVQPSTTVDFSAALKATLDQVNQRQSQAEEMGKSFAMGDDKVSLSDVMIAGQKANISLQATVQVRNKLISAYHDIMNMPV
jgi:flagellar hook-basal body complex protein FliE